MSADREQSEPIIDRKVPSLLNDIKSATLDFIRLKKEPSRSAYSGAVGAGIMGAGLGGPLGAAIGMIVGGLAGEVVDRRYKRDAQ